jgi:hypothetical protein
MEPVGNVLFGVPVPEEVGGVFHYFAGGGDSVIPFLEGVQHWSGLGFPQEELYIGEVLALQAFPLSFVDELLE